MLLLTVLAIIESIQLVTLIATIYSFIPVDTSMREHIMYSSWISYHPEREMFFFRILVFMAIIFQIGFIKVFSHRLNNDNLFKKMSHYTAASFILLINQFYWLFKIAVYKSPIYVKEIFYVSLALALIIKPFWSVLSRYFKAGGQKAVALLSERWAVRLLDIGLPVFLFAALFIPDVKGLLSHCFVHDYLEHIDAFVMGSGWAAFKGAIVNVDVYQIYGLGVPVFFGKIMQLMGGFSYENFLMALLSGIIIYFIMCYFFLKKWLKIPWLAAAGVFLAIKYQFFSYPPTMHHVYCASKSAVRFFFDIPVFFFLLRHLETRKMRDLIIAGIFSGIALYYITSTGVYLTGSFYLYLILLMVCPASPVQLGKHKIAFFKIGMCFLIPVGVFSLGLLWGGQMFHSEFWQSIFQVARDFSGGLAAIPIYKDFESGQFFHILVVVIMLLGYLFSLLFIGALVWKRRIAFKNIMAIIISAYGLGLYHYYVSRSNAVAVTIVAMPFIFIACYVFGKLLSLMNEKTRKGVIVMAFVGALGALFTTHTFIKYPNVFNFTGVSFAETKVKMDQSFISQEDVALVKKYTDEDQKVCFVGSFEVATLMAAGRRPFFFNFNLMRSEFMDKRAMRGFLISQKRELERAFAQLTDEKPEVVFIEKRLFLEIIPRDFYKFSDPLRVIVNYLQEFYKAKDAGQYLLVLELKE